MEQLSKWDEKPEWFEKGMKAVSMALTAMNQQKFLFKLKDGNVAVKALMRF